MSFEVSFFQIVASLALTFASLTVAIVSAYFTFRHNRGWKPIILVLAAGRAGPANTPPKEILLLFEVWNRKKYPIVIDTITVAFSKFDFIGPTHDDEVEITEKTQWFRDGRTFDSHHDVSLEQNSKSTFSILAEYKPADPKDKERACISVRYFDPIRNKYREVKSRIIDV